MNEVAEEYLLQKAITAIKTGDKETGRKLLHSSIEQSEDITVAWCWLSSIASDLYEAIGCLRHALQHDPDSDYAKDSIVKLLFKAGVENAKKKDNKTAYKYFEEVLEFQPENEHALIWKAGLAKTTDEAIEILEQVLQINPSNDKAINGLQQLRGQNEFKCYCPFCATGLKVEDPKQCTSCKSVLTISEPEAFLIPSSVNKEMLKAKAQELHNKAKAGVDLHSIYFLGLCYLNLGYHKEGIRTLQAYCKKQPGVNDLANQVERLTRQLSQSSEVPANKMSSLDKSVSILVVDDSPTIQKLVSSTLSGVGYRVSKAGSAEEAIDYIKNNKAPNLFILDVNMPGMDGFQLCKTIRNSRETGKVPVIFLTGKDGFLNKLKGQWVGGSEYLNKPFDPKKLVETVKKILPVNQSNE